MLLLARVQTLVVISTEYFMPDINVMFIHHENPEDTVIQMKNVTWDFSFAICIHETVQEQTHIFKEIYSNSCCMQTT